MVPHQIEMTANLPDSRSLFKRTFRDSRSQPRNIQDSIPRYKNEIKNFFSGDTQLPKYRNQITCSNYSFN